VPPGVDIDENIERAQEHHHDPWIWRAAFAAGFTCVPTPLGPLCLGAGAFAGDDLFWFVNQIRENGEWDFKLESPTGDPLLYEPFGNFHFGIIAAAIGLPPEIAKCGAGLVHIITNRGPTGGVLECGDDPDDQRRIDEGYRWYENCWKSS
jgi:hypothetical protein